MSAPVTSRLGRSSSARSAFAARYAIAVAGVIVLGGFAAWLAGFNLWAGAAGGLVLGVLAARPMLRPLSAPRLVLGRDNIYLVRRNKKALVIPWAAISAIRPGGALVTLEFSEEIEAPGEGMISGLGLEAARFGMSAEAMALALEVARQRRPELPDDETARASLRR